jgi:hypothetical protein
VWQYLDGTADLTFIDARGYTTELLSGDRLRPIDTAVPHQLFSTTGFMAGFIRGLLGFKEPPASDADAPIVLEPQLPAEWPELRVRRLRWRDAIFDLAIAQDPRGVEVSVSHEGKPRPVVVRLALPPGAEPAHGMREVRFDGVSPQQTRRVAVQSGIVIAPVHKPLRVGDESQRLRVLSTRFDGRRYVARLEGRRGRTYEIRAFVPFKIESIAGGAAKGEIAPAGEIAVTFPGDGDDWAPRELVITVGARMSPAVRREQP